MKKTLTRIMLVAMVATGFTGISLGVAAASASADPHCVYVTVPPHYAWWQCAIPETVPNNWCYPTRKLVCS